MFCKITCIKPCKYQQILTLHLPLQQANKCKNTDIYSVSEQWLLQKIAIFGAFFPKFHAVGTLKIRANSQNLIFC